MFIFALFIISKTWKQTRCPLVGKWANEDVGHLDDGILFTAKKKWAHKLWKAMGESKFILPRGRSQSEKATLCRIPSIWYSGKGKTVETIKG